MLLAFALLLAVAGSSALATGMGADRPTTVSLSGGNRTPVTEADLFVPQVAVPATTSSTAVVVATTTTTMRTAAETTPTTVAAITATTMLPVNTTTTLPQLAPNTVRIDSIVNHYPHAIELAIGSDDSSARWVLEPDETGAPALITLGGHDSSGSHVVSTPSCGRGDQDNYFTEGHHYTIEIVKNGVENACEGGLPGYWAILRDVTAGTSKTF